MTPRWMTSVARIAAPRPAPVAAAGGDADLLAHYADHGDPAAFAALVERHGPAVRGVCRARLRNPANADDAAQAAFYVLARDARKVRDRAAVAGWLVRVAHLTCLKSRRQFARHAAGELPADLPTATQPDEAADRERDAIVAEELAALPERLRAVLVLCAIEGHSNAEAAAALNCPKGTVDSRLAAAKTKLRDRLVRRGLGAAAVAAVETTLPRLGAGPPAAWAWADAAAAAALGYARKAAPVTTLTLLADGVLTTMTTTTKLAATALLATALLTTAGLGLTQIPGPGDGPPTPAKPAPPAAVLDAKPAEPKEPAKPRELKSGTNPVTTEAEAREVFGKYAGNVGEKMTLRELIAKLNEQHGLIVRLDTSEYGRLRGLFFTGILQAEAQGDPIAFVLSMYDMKLDMPGALNMKVSDLLREACAQLPGSNAYRVKDGQVLIGPAFRPAAIPHAPPQIGGQSIPIDTMSLMEQTFGPAVSVALDDVPLASAVKELRRITGANIVIDPNGYPADADKSRVIVSGTYDDVRLYSVLEILANQCGFQLVYVSNVYYLTTPEKAAVIQRRVNTDLYGTAAVPEGYVSDGSRLYPKPDGLKPVNELGGPGVLPRK